MKFMEPIFKKNIMLVLRENAFLDVLLQYPNLMKIKNIKKQLICLQTIKTKKLKILICDIIVDLSNHYMLFICKTKLN